MAEDGSEKNGWGKTVMRNKGMGVGSVLNVKPGDHEGEVKRPTERATETASESKKKMVKKIGTRTYLDANDKVVTEKHEYWAEE